MNHINKSKTYKIFCILILLIMFLIMCLYASKQSLGLDELDATIECFAKPDIVDMFKSILNTGYNLPLLYIIMFPIYRIMPYGELWILLPCIISVIIGVYIMKKIGNKIGGEDLGFASLCIAATSCTLIYNAAFEIRPYAFLFCFGALTLYTFICKLEEPKKKKRWITYTISLILLAYTHWFGCLMVAFYFLVDVVVLLIRKKLSLSFIIPYLCTGLVFLPWLILMLMKHTTDFTQYWGGRPTINSIKSVIKFLLSDNYICIILFAISIFIIGLSIITKKKKINKTYKYICLCLCSILWALGTIFIYSRYINAKGSLWVSRYFICILPQTFIITAFPISELLHFKISIDNKERKIVINDIEISSSLTSIIVIFIIAIIGYQNYASVAQKSNLRVDTYREGSNIIANRPALYEKNSAVITSEGQGYLTYYFEKQGYSLPQNVYRGYSTGWLAQVVGEGSRMDIRETNIKDLLKYDILCLFSVHNKFKEDFLSFINENYNLVEKNKEYNVSIYEKKMEK